MSFPTRQYMQLAIAAVLVCLPAWTWAQTLEQMPPTQANQAQPVDPQRQPISKQDLPGPTSANQAVDEPKSRESAEQKIDKAARESGKQSTGSSQPATGMTQQQWDRFIERQVMIERRNHLRELRRELTGEPKQVQQGTQ